MILFTDMSQDSYRDQWHTQGKLIRTSAPARFLVRGKEAVLESGDLLFIRPAELYRAEEVLQDSIEQLAFDGNYLTEDPAIARIFDEAEPLHLITDLEPALKTAVTALFDTMKSCAGSNDAFRETRLKALLLQLILTYTDARSKREEGRKKTAASPHKTEIMQKFEEACTYIKEHCRQELAEEEVAAFIGFSPYYFSRSFKKYVGIRYSDYLSEVRVRKAAALLQEGTVPVREAGFMAGFQSVSNYNRAFKAVMGCTPSRYKKDCEKRSLT